MPKVLFVLTSHGKMDPLDKETGWYLPEAAHPYYELVNEGVEVEFASPKGGKAPLDPSSVEAFKEDKQCQQFLKEKLQLTENTNKLSQYKGRAGDFDAIFFVGGHGPMYDLAHNSESHELISEFFKAGKVVSAVCHGPAALAYAKVDGEYLIKGQPVTGFSNSEEDAVQLTKYMPFKLEDALSENSGGKFEKADKDWGECVKSGHNGKLLTGQNPASAGPIGQAILKSIKA